MEVGPTLVRSCVIASVVAGAAETAAWGLRAQTALYTACTGGREELGFHASISGISAGVVGVLGPEWSASGMSAAHGAQFYTFVSGAGPSIRHVDVGPVNVTAYGNIRVLLWARIEMPEDDQARVFASYSTAGATSYMLDVDAGTIGATADTWTEYSETIAPNAELVSDAAGHCPCHQEPLPSVVFFHSLELTLSQRAALHPQDIRPRPAVLGRER